MEQIAIGLLIWIAAHSGYDTAQLVPPPIVLLTHEAMAQTMAGDASDSAALQANLDQRVQGYYDPADGPRGTIYLIRAEDTPAAERYAEPADNPLFRERLLHELVHFAQQATGAYERFRCRSQGERDAYELGGQYLRQHNLPDPLPDRRLVARMLMLC